MDEHFEGKCFFVTGATGFLGKALVEKLLRCAPTVDKIIVLIRPRKGDGADERLQKEIVGSRIFDRLRAELGAEEFSARVSSKLIAVAGDITSPGLDLRPEDARMVRERAQIVVHSAASVQFNEPLNVAVKMNCAGALNAVRFARSLSKLECYVHVSTAYVNSNLRDQRVREQLYPLAFDVHDAFERVTRAEPSELEQLRAQLMGDYPNTYALTKSMGEHLVAHEVGVGVDSASSDSATRFPLVINRPTIVGAAWKDPVPGWIDQIAAAGAVYVAIGMGVVTMLPGFHRNVLDIVPVDISVNSILLSACARIARDRRASAEAPNAAAPPYEPMIVHCGTSDPRQNPKGSGYQFDVVADYFRKHPLRGAEFPASFRMIDNAEDFQAQWLRSYVLPTSKCVEKAERSGNPSDMKRAEKLQKRMYRAGRLMEAYKPFTTNQWVFLADSTFNALNEFSSPTLPADTRAMDWKSYLESFCAGLKSYALPGAAAIGRDVARAKAISAPRVDGHKYGGPRRALTGFLQLARSKL